METWDAVTSRRNVRQYVDKPIAEEDLNMILEAARRAPSSRNEQRWDFVIVTGRDRLEELSKVWRYGRHVASSAATVALVTPHSDDSEEREPIAFDLGQAAMSMMIVAADLGIGSCHSSVQDQDLARSLLGYPADRRCDYLIALGYPDDRPMKPLKKPDRRPFDEVVHRQGW